MNQRVRYAEDRIEDVAQSLELLGDDPGSDLLKQYNQAYYKGSILGFRKENN